MPTDWHADNAEARLTRTIGDVLVDLLTTQTFTTYADARETLLERLRQLKIGATPDQIDRAIRQVDTQRAKEHLSPVVSIASLRRTPAPSPPPPELSRKEAFEVLDDLADRDPRLAKMLGRPTRAAHTDPETGPASERPVFFPKLMRVPE